MSPSRKRVAVAELEHRFSVSERRACRTLDQPRSSQRYVGQPRHDEGPLRKRLRELARRRPRFGYRQIARLLRHESWKVGDGRVYRLWRQEGLKVPVKSGKRRRLGSSDQACHVDRATAPNDVWCWDFIFDRTMSGQTLKWLSVIDEFTRELLILKVDRSITSEDVIDSLAKLIAYRGVPRAIRGDNGPEFVARSIRDWLARLGVSTLYIEPGSPWQNGYAESFHSRLRDEFLRVEVFPSLREAQSLTATWQHDYNTVRPHGSIEGMTPAMFADRWAASAWAPAAPPPSLPQPIDFTQPFPS